MALRKFVRYRNRKVHEVGTTDVHHNGLGKLEALVVKGDDIEVIDDATGEDLTLEMLAHILFLRCRRDSTAATVKEIQRLIMNAAKRKAA